MPDESPTQIIRHLEAENARLRQIHEDERDHLQSLRAEVRELQNEVARLAEDRDRLKARLRQLGGEEA